MGQQLCRYIGLKYLKGINTQGLQRCWKTGSLGLHGWLAQAEPVTGGLSRPGLRAVGGGLSEVTQSSPSFSFDSHSDPQGRKQDRRGAVTKPSLPLCFYP